MENSKKIVVLRELRQILWIITAYNRENFQVPHRKTLWRNIAVMVAYSFCLVMFALLLVSGAWSCVDCNFDIKESSLPVSVTVSIVQMIGMYISLACNNRKISRLIDSLQGIIDKRESFALCSTLLLIQFNRFVGIFFFKKSR